uniref:Probable protein-export membrane protein SecG n=1 Tax=Lophocladia kuetzingii TaxID=675577 RepID=A0A1Z1MNI7_9FLOR|nr:preprotein-translocase subunit g [Lophocladia kuetzingii]ARW67660.1 preprotein-translocase subunit g [Lophocladia kuetzingii]
MIQILWYISCIFTIILILINSPSSNINSNLLSENKLFNVSSNQSFINQFIFFNIFLFFLLTIISLLIL